MINTNNNPELAAAALRLQSAYEGRNGRKPGNPFGQPKTIPLSALTKALVYRALVFLDARTLAQDLVEALRALSAPQVL